MNRLIPFISLCLAAQGPLQVGTPLPPLLDLRDADAAVLVPRDARDPAQAEATRRAWNGRIRALAAEPALRLRLPVGEARCPLLLAASQALKAQNPDQCLYLDWDADATSLWDENAWGALQGGSLGPEDLGNDPAAWRDRLARAQEQLPGRPWLLWLPADPGAWLGQLLGDGAHLVVPPGGPAARLAVGIPEGFTEVEGGMGDLTLRRREGGSARRWRFEAGEWQPVALPRDRHEVSVTGRDAYDVGALLARMRAAQLRDRAAILTQEASLDVNLHVQGSQGPGVDLGFSFRTFEQAGEGEEMLQREVRVNGVKANLPGGVELPIIESRASLAAPVALSLTERYRYSDGGPGEAGQRWIRFVPVDADATLFRGELLVDEASGRILEERSERSELPGTVRSERRILRYGEAAPRGWRVMGIQTFERWVSPGGVAQVQRRLEYRDFLVNDPGFAERRRAARESRGTMLKQTLGGQRYFTRQADGSRKVEDKLKSSGRAIGGVLLVDPSMALPVTPLAGLTYFDYNAFDRGIQLFGLTALVYNSGNFLVPRLPGGFDLAGSLAALLLPTSERPVKDGRLTERDAVDRRSGTASLRLGHDLGAGFRFELEGRFECDRFSRTRETKYETPGFALPPSGWTREGRGHLTWLFRGFQLGGYYGAGRRPDGTYGTVAEPQEVPEGGSFRRWGAHAGYDFQAQHGTWLHGEAGIEGGRAFDRFKSLALGGTGGDVRIAGIRSNAIAADRITYAKGGVVLPSGPNLRLTLTLDHARARSLDNQQSYGFTGLGVAGDLPGFWCFTFVRVDLGLGLHSDIPGLRTVNGWVALMRVF